MIETLETHQMCTRVLKFMQLEKLLRICIIHYIICTWGIDDKMLLRAHIN